MRCATCGLDLSDQYVERFGPTHGDPGECIEALRQVIEGRKNQEPSDLIEEITRRRNRRLAARGRQYQRKNPIASDIDPDGCLRKQVLEIVRWEDKPLLDSAYVQGLFEAGEWLENRCKSWLIDDGFDIMEGQTRFELKHRTTDAVCLSGKTDFAIGWGKDKPRVEHKLVSPFVFGSIREAGDFNTSKFPWMKKYPAQLQSYLIGQNEPWGLFMITDGRGDWRPLPVELDYEYAERIWTYSEKIIEWVDVYRMSHADGDPELPSFIEDTSDCPKCPFYGRTCNPPLENDGPALLANGKLEGMLVRREEIIEPGKEYDKLDKKVKAVLKEVRPETDRAVIGSFVVEWAQQKNGVRTKIQAV